MPRGRNSSPIISLFRGWRFREMIRHSLGCISLGLSEAGHWYRLIFPASTHRSRQLYFTSESHTNYLLHQFHACFGLLSILHTDSPAMPVVPPELSDYIIDFLHNDSCTLRACSLTCRAWLPASRYHLLNKVALHNARLCSAFHELLKTTPNLGLYVRELNISQAVEPREIVNDIVATSSFVKLVSQIFTHMRWVTDLRLCLIDMLPATSFGILRHQSITDISLSYCRFLEFADFVDFFYAFPQLKCLTLGGVTWRHGRTPRRLSPTPVLQKLVLGRDMDLATLVDWLVSEELHTSIETFSVRCASEDDADVVGPFLDILGPSLRHLELDWYLSRVKEVCLPRSITLQQCNDLETLSLHCPILFNASLPWVTSLLTHVNAHSIRTISWDIRLLGDVDALDWESISRILCTPMFRNLEALMFKVVVWPGVHLDTIEVKRLIRKRLSHFDSKGMVHFSS
ncbi:hypothetical protein A0H81_00964 [Grifola frondosa]|uniref:F-box domain-containing protein n=1 Tax=Grifola frondosa TaxID=5627 RepID=A0A1C7MR34_GRIFR|nr:hypothetical protein A0H81_00964 [Grifola frondosa]